jgi:hypothetical protein
MKRDTVRTWAVRLTYASIAGHLLVGALLPLIAGAALFDAYHHGIETAFWGAQIPAAARAQQVWWISLFGPTVQAAAVWMGALAWIGDRQRNAFAWGALIAGIVLWAPQDMLISLRANCWTHVWIDSFALLCTLPPLICLFYIDRAKPTLGIPEVAA